MRDELHTFREPATCARLAPAFIIGVARSGTTLLANLMGCHPDVAPIYETRFLRNLLALCAWAAAAGKSGSMFRRIDRLFGEPRLRAMFRRECERFRRKAIAYGEQIPDGDGRKQSYESFPFGENSCIHYTAEELARETDRFVVSLAQAEINGDEVGRAAREYVDRLFSIHCVRMNRPYWINKTPGLVNHLERLPLLYPESRCLHLLRDGRDVAASNLSLPWGPKTVADAARRWKRLILTGRQAQRSVRLGYMELRFEDITEQPRPSLDRAFSFFGLDVDVDSILRQFPVAKNRQGRWRDTFTRSERETFAREAGDLLIELGYESDTAWV